MGKTNSIESIIINKYETGQSFYTEKNDKDITAIASYYKKKVKTERLVCIECRYMKTITKLTKVTIL